ncbi:uncharacterized protein SOCEGT47_060470 [Sorangium cellulosum]|uniref:Uncharacterized protein n=1 Tax=Sorangium cellulosum TaxID=56 RepID=A0A4P2Q7P4_SORCE|nr:uncharacterized protein SOCEGT47_060470 [Sorangium cellulosum]
MRAERSLQPSPSAAPLLRKPKRVVGLAALSHRRAAIVVPARAALARLPGLDGDVLERELVLVEVGDADRVAAAPRAAVAAGPSLAAPAAVTGAEFIPRRSARCASTASAAFLGGPAVAAIAAGDRRDHAVAHGHPGVKREDADGRMSVRSPAAPAASATAGPARASAWASLGGRAAPGDPAPTTAPPPPPWPGVPQRPGPAAGVRRMASARASRAGRRALAHALDARTHVHGDVLVWIPVDSESCHQENGPRRHVARMLRKNGRDR